MANDGEIDPAIAAAMGFTSFGSGNGRATKKRRLHDDAFIDGQPSREEDAGVRVSGTNNIPLGRRRPRQQDDQEEGGTGERPFAETQDATVATVGGGDVAAAVVPRGHEKEGKRKGGRGTKGAADLQAGGLAAFMSHAKDLPARPSEGAALVVAGTGMGADDGRTAAVGADGGKEDEGASATAELQYDGYSLEQLRHGVPNGRGDMAYFLPSFLEDPWEDLR